MVLLPNPSSVASAAGGLVHVLEIKDPRYSIECYGVFFETVPQRLHSDRLLEAAVGAVVSAFPSVYSTEPSAMALADYGRVLGLLRGRLEDGSSVWTIELLCTIYFVLICQACY